MIRGMALYQEVSCLLVILAISYQYLTTITFCVTVKDKKEPAKGVNNTVAVTTNMEDEKKPRGRFTPYKAKDLVPLVRAAVSKNPLLSNKDMESLLVPYGKTGATVSVCTDSLLQNTRKRSALRLLGKSDV